MLPAAVDQALNLSPDEAAARLSALPEDQWFERKSGAIRPLDFAVPLVAMANAEGGVIVVGFHGGRVVPVSDKAANALRQTPADFTTPRVRVEVTELLSSEGRILVFHVPPSDHVHETKRGNCYQRIGDESRKLTYAQRQELEWDRGVASFDGTPVRDVTVADLDDVQLSAYQRTLGSSSPELALRARDLIVRGGTVTVAGYLLFASRPQMLFPNAHVRVLKYQQNERGTGRTLNLEDDADIRCEGSIPEQIAQATAAIDSLAPRRRALTDSGRFEGVSTIPKDVWLEGLVNAVVHRSYSIGGDHVRVEIFPNRIEITSPGRFPGLVNPADPASISRNARNPRIARVCADMGVTQELGEGIRRMFAEMRRAGLSNPKYVQGPEAVRLTLMATMAPSDRVVRQIAPNTMKILDALRLAQRPLSTGQLVELVGMARPTVLRHLNVLRDADLVVWEGESRRDPRATWRAV
ncbi:ATP-binding protein [Actinomyces sp. MRS3W]|uniref:ATP-binding protein n=1 Tax=Actinomyces sp. MRS3W TaxID=2800796 RepID=UPI0028FD95BE|nr:ATP-binding protein [Actinomyces sp. MRS3W]MDU0348048.1 ATP-binding protein [Actinomyces sp. MRS3W]